MKNWIFIFMISMITLPGYGKVKVQKPKMKFSYCRQKGSEI